MKQYPIDNLELCRTLLYFSSPFDGALLGSECPYLTIRELMSFSFLGPRSICNQATRLELGRCYVNAPRAGINPVDLLSNLNFLLSKKMRSRGMWGRAPRVPFL